MLQHPGVPSEFARGFAASWLRKATSRSSISPVCAKKWKGKESSPVQTCLPLQCNTWQCRYSTAVFKKAICECVCVCMSACMCVCMQYYCAMHTVAGQLRHSPMHLKATGEILQVYNPGRCFCSFGGTVGRCSHLCGCMMHVGQPIHFSELPYPQKSRERGLASIKNKWHPRTSAKE